jgi:hypothetical protein
MCDDVMQFCGVTDPHVQHQYVSGSRGDWFDFYFCCPGSTGDVGYEARYRALRAAIEALHAELRTDDPMSHCDACANQHADRLTGLLAETGDDQ